MTETSEGGAKRRISGSSEGLLRENVSTTRNLSGCAATKVLRGSNDDNDHATRRNSILTGFGLLDNDGIPRPQSSGSPIKSEKTAEKEDLINLLQNEPSDEYIKEYVIEQMMALDAELDDVETNYVDELDDGRGKFQQFPDIFKVPIHANTHNTFLKSYF
jgi:hypothetical protein